jgi:hypothetical protein
MNSSHDGAPFVLATPETIWDRTYPLHQRQTRHSGRNRGNTILDSKVLLEILWKNRGKLLPGE